MMEKYDIIVIGAGPAGSFFAENIGKKYKVLILDKAKFPRNKLCAGWITLKVLKTLGISKEEYPHKIEVLKNTNYWIEDKKYLTKQEKWMNFGIIRKEFDNYLLKRAIKAGAKFKQLAVNDIEFKKDHVIVKTSKKDFKSKIVIGAGGTFCPLYRKINNGLKEDFIICLEAQQKFKQKINTNIFLEKDLRGYAWCFTKKGYINIGVGRINEKNIKLYKDQFIKTLKRLKIIPKNLKLKFEGYFYRVNDNKKRILAGRRFLLIGDSAGVADKINGEGIGPALYSAKIGSGHIMKCLKENKYDLSSISSKEIFNFKYGVKYPKWFLKFLISSKLIRMILFYELYKKMFKKRKN